MQEEVSQLPDNPSRVAGYLRPCRRQFHANQLGLRCLHQPIRPAHLYLQVTKHTHTWNPETPSPASAISRFPPRFAHLPSLSTRTTCFSAGRIMEEPKPPHTLLNMAIQAASPPTSTTSKEEATVSRPPDGADEPVPRLHAKTFLAVLAMNIAYFATLVSLIGAGVVSGLSSNPFH